MLHHQLHASAGSDQRPESLAQYDQQATLLKQEANRAQLAVEIEMLLIATDNGDDDGLVIASLFERLSNLRIVSPRVAAKALAALAEDAPHEVLEWLADEHRSICACCRTRHEATTVAPSTEAH